jgi:hypothetical protein
MDEKAESITIRPEEARTATDDEVDHELYIICPAIGVSNPFAASVALHCIPATTDSCNSLSLRIFAFAVGSDINTQRREHDEAQTVILQVLAQRVLGHFIAVPIFAVAGNFAIDRRGSQRV